MSSRMHTIKFTLIHNRKKRLIERFGQFKALTVKNKSNFDFLNLLKIRSSHHKLIVKLL